VGWRVAAAIVGYLLGSLSFARIVTRLAEPGGEVKPIDMQLSTGEVFTSDMVSATAVRVSLGTRYGLLTGLLDALKVAVPAMVLRRLRPGDSSYVALAAGGVLGHNLPVYHGFKGGRGESPIYGVMLSVDPVGVVATAVAGLGLGFAAGSLLVLRWAGLVLLVPWFALVRHDRPLALFAAFANVAYFTALRSELRQFVGMLRRGTLPSEEEIGTGLAMGGSLGRAFDRYSLRALLQRRLAHEDHDHAHADDARLPSVTRDLPGGRPHSHRH